MAKQWLFIPMVVALGTSVALTPASDRGTRSEVKGLEQEALVAAIDIDRCVRACLSCDQGNMLSCVICASCSEPAITMTNH